MERDNFVLSKTASIEVRARQVSSFLFEAAEQADESMQVESSAWEVLHSTGLTKAPLPPSFGGEGLCDPKRYRDLCTVLRLIGSGDLSVARLFEGHVNAIALVCRYGTRVQVARLAERVVAGELSAVWGAEDAQGLKVVCTDDGIYLAGRKILASGAGFITQPLITAAAADGQIMYLLELSLNERSDVTGWKAQGMRSTATGTVELSGLPVRTDRVVGLPGDFMRQPYFSGGAWRFCAAQLGAIERLVDLLRDHLVSRDRTGDAYQMQRLAQCAAASKTARFWVEDAARRLSDEAGDTLSIVAFGNLTRMVVERCALDVIETVQRGVGLTAFIRPNPIERVCRDLATYLRQPVPDLAMADAARHFLASQRSIGDF